MGSSLFHHLLLLVALVVVSQVTKADEGLMGQQCRYANDPTICMQCLKSDPTSPQSDSVGLARVILKCITSHVNALSQTVSSLASSHPETPVANALSQCDWAYRTTKNLVGRADDSLNRGVYKEAKFLASKAVSLPMGCEKNLESLKVPLPPSFPSDTNAFTALIDAELKIIDHL